MKVCIVGAIFNIIVINAGETVTGALTNKKVVADGDSLTLTNTGSITTNGDSILCEGNTDITIEGKVKNTGDVSAGVNFDYRYSNNKVVISSSGTITSEGMQTAAIYGNESNNIISNGTITVDGGNVLGPFGAGADAIFVSKNNQVAVGGSIDVKGKKSNGIRLTGSGNVCSLSGAITAESGYALITASYGGNGEAVNTVHILDGAILNSGIHNGAKQSNSSSNITFGYSKGADGKADASSPDSNFNFVMSEGITSDSTGRWKSSFVAGTTTLNGSANSLATMSVGTSLSTAILNVTNSVDTNDIVTIEAGSTYNLSGTHIHTGSDMTIEGILNLTDGGELINNATGGTQTIANFKVSSGTGTISGTRRIGNIDNVDIDGILNFNLNHYTTFISTNLAGTINCNSSRELSLKDLTIDATKTGSLSGSGTGSFRITDTVRNAGILNITKNIRTTGSLIVDAAGTYNLSSAHTHTGDDMTINGVLNLKDGGELINNATGGTQTIANLKVSSGTGTISGTNSIGNINNVDIDGILDFELNSNTSFISTNLSGTISQNSSSNLYLTNLTIDSTKIGTLSGSGTGALDITGTLSNAGILNVTKNITTTGSLTVGASGTYNLSSTHTHTGSNITIDGVLDLAGGGELINNATGGTQRIANLQVSSGTGTISGSGGSLSIVNAATIDGSLNINREVTFTGGIVSIGANSVLGGSGTIIGNIATGGNGGIINPNGTLSVVGDVTVSANDNLDMLISDNLVDKLMATGKVDMTTSAVNIAGMGGQVGSTYTMIEATELSNLVMGDVNLIDSSELMDYTINISNSKLVVKAVKVGGAYEDAAATGDGSNSELASSLSSLTSDHPLSMDGMFDELNSLPNDRSVNTAMSQLNTQNSSSSSVNLALSSVHNSNNILNRQFATFHLGASANAYGSGVGFTSAGDTSDMASADELEKAYSSFDSYDSVETGVLSGFMKVYGGFGEQGSCGDCSGYNYNHAGVMSGIDYTFSHELRIGGIVDYSYSSSRMYNNIGNGVDRTLRVGPFSSYQWDNFFIDSAPTIALHMIKTNRNIDFLNTTAKGERAGVDLDWLNTLGYKFELPKGFIFTPSYSLSFTTFYDQNYTETGAIGGANLKVDSYTSYSLLQNIDLKLSRLIKINDNLSIMPEVWAGWEHEYLGSGADVTSAFAAAPSESWTTPIVKIAPNRVVFGFAITALVSDNTSLFARYDQKIWKRGYETSFSLGIKINF